MKYLRTLLVVAVCIWSASASLVWPDDEVEARRLTAEAEGMFWLGLEENGSGGVFAEGLDMLDRAGELLATSGTSDADRARLERRIQLLREDLTFNLERSRGRFYGAFPLARVMQPFPLMLPPEDVIETVHPEPAVEAVRTATERVVVDIVRIQHPQVVFRSVPPNRGFENEAMRVFNNANAPYANSRADLVSALTAEDLASFDSGDVHTGVIGRLMESLGATDLLVLTIVEGAHLPDAEMVVLKGSFFEDGSEAPTDTFVHMGFSRGRRQMVRWIVAVHLLLFVAALVVAGSTRWSVATPWPMIQRFAMGAALFMVGRIFAPFAVMALRKVIPQPDAAVAASWWWPALVGLVLILGSGLVAWVAQARVTRIVPGTRASRAVGMTFALAALGACAYLSEPLLLLVSHGAPTVFVPLLLSSFVLAALLGNAIRTGPPVPHYFAIGPLVAAPAAGLALLMVSAALLWAVVVASALLCAVAVARHRYFVAHGLEQVEPDEADAEKQDMERLAKIGKDVKKTLPV